MSTKLCDVLLKETSNQYEYALWADKNFVDVAEKIDGVHQIWKITGNSYTLAIDPRYDAVSVAAEIVALAFKMYAKNSF